MSIKAQGKADLKGDIPFFLDIDFNHNDLNQFIDMSGFWRIKNRQHTSFKNRWKSKNNR